MKTTVVKICNIVYPAIALFVFVVVLNNYTVAEEKKMQTVRSFLSEIGRQLDCYFTIESVGGVGLSNNPILDGKISVPSEGIQDVNDLMSFLTTKGIIPWEGEGKTNTIRLLADRIECNKMIIRLRDTRLSQVINYALAKKVSAKYDGNPDGLLRFLSVRNPLIQPEVSFTVGMGPIEVNDSLTPITVNVENKNVKDLLTKCVPLSGYNRIIWSSYTDGKIESPIVTVKFHGKQF